MPKAKDGVKFGNLAISIDRKEALVLKDSAGNIIARILVNERHQGAGIIRVLVQAPREIDISREWVDKKNRIPGVLEARNETTP